MNTYRILLNISVAMVLVISMYSNAVLAMGNEQDDQNMNRNPQYQCSLNKQDISATTKSPHSGRSYDCTPLASSEKIKNQGVTSAKSPNKENRSTNDHDSLNSQNSSSKSTWDDDFTDQRTRLFPAP